MRTPTVCCGSTCPRGLTCPCTRKPSSTKWLGSSTNDHARLCDLQPQPNDLMLVLHRPLAPAHGQRTIACPVCSGLGGQSFAGVIVGICGQCHGSGQCRCDVCGGAGEVDPD